MSKQIETGTLKQYAGAQYHEMTYTMIWLDESFLKQVMTLQQLAFDHLDNPEIYQLQPEKFFKEQCGKAGRTIGVLVKNELIAFQVLHFPALASDPFDIAENLGFDLQLQEEELQYVAHLETNAVHPSYIGHALAGKMSFYLTNEARALGYTHLCATIAPENCGMVVGLLNANIGVFIRSLKEKYGEKLRYIIYRNLRNSAYPEFHQFRNINVVDVQQQQDALAQGFWGYKGQRTGQGFEIVYGK